MKQQLNEDNKWLRFLVHGEEVEPYLKNKGPIGGPKKPSVSNKQRRAIRHGN